LPEEVKNLLDIVVIKHMCKAAGISSVEVGPKGAVIGYHNDSPTNLQGLMHWMTSKRGQVKLRPDQKIVLAHAWEGGAARARGVKGVLEELAAL